MIMLFNLNYNLKNKNRPDLSPILKEKCLFPNFAPDCIYWAIIGKNVCCTHFIILLEKFYFKNIYYKLLGYELLFNF